MVVLGRKEEEILDSAFLKRMEISNPTDWSRYADDPDGIMNQRKITREERRRQFQVSLAVGDPRRTAPRLFRPLFEEKKAADIEIDSYADGARIRFLRATGGRFWDRLYLALLGWFLVLFPAVMENDFDLGCRARSPGDPSHLADRSGGACTVLWPPLVLMTLAVAPPALGALFMRVFAFDFLKKQRGERRHWSFFFVLALKAAAQPATVPEEFVDSFLYATEYAKACLRKRLGKKFGKVAPADDDDDDDEPSDDEEDVAEGPAPAPGGAPSPKKGFLAAARLMAAGAKSKRNVKKKRKAVEEGPAEALGKRAKIKAAAAAAAGLKGDTQEDREITQKRAMDATSALHKLHHEDEARKVVWRCVSCGRDNREPLSTKHPESVEMLVHRIQRKSGGDDRICASFKTERYVPTCSTCGTPMNYKIRPSNAHAFHDPSGDAIHAFTLLNAERAAQDKRIEEEKKREKDRQRRAAKKKKGGAADHEPSAGAKAVTKAIGAIKMGAARKERVDWQHQKVQFDALTGLRLDDASVEEEKAEPLAKRLQRGALVIVTDPGADALGGPRRDSPTRTPGGSRKPGTPGTPKTPGTPGTPGSLGSDRDTVDAAAYIREMMAAEEAAKKKKNLANCFRKVKEAYVKVRKFLRRKDMHYGDDKMLFNDWSFAKKVKQFKPQPDRRALRHLEHYDVGAEVESFEHMPTWYPAVVVKYNANGSYVLRFDNGEVADAVDPAHIRFRVAPPISGLQQFVCASLLVVFAVWPAWIALYLAERGFRASGPGVLVVPLLLFALLMMVAIALQMFLLFLRGGQEAGCNLFCKISSFYMLAPFLLFVFVCVCLAGDEGFGALIPLALFLGALVTVAATVKPLYRYLFTAATMPLLLFAALLAEWSTQDGRGYLHGRAGALRGRLYFIFLPLFGCYAMAWWLLNNLPYIWDANFAAPDAVDDAKKPPNIHQKRFSRLFKRDSQDYGKSADGQVIFGAARGRTIFMPH